MPPSITSRLRAGAAVGVATVLLLSACSQSNTPSIAHAAQLSSTGHSSTDSTSTQTQVQKYVASIRAYAECARAAGIDIPDPDPSGNLSTAPGLKAQVAQDPVKSAALTQCAKLVLPVPASIAYPDLTPAQFAAAKKFAKCMRAHGVPDYPDPSIHTAPVPESSAAVAAKEQEAATPAYQQAITTCNTSVYGPGGAG